MTYALDMDVLEAKISQWTFFLPLFLTLVLTFGHPRPQNYTRWNFPNCCSVKQNGRRKMAANAYGGKNQHWSRDFIDSLN